MVLHAGPQLSVSGAWLGNTTGGPRAKLRDRPTDQQLILEFARPVPAGNVTLHFEFWYTLSEGLAGLYRCERP